MPVKDRDNYNEYMREYMLRRYYERKEEARALLGGVCVVCGTDEDLQFDHIDPALKSFTINSLWSLAKHKYLAELEKCQLLCETHHLEKTIRERSVPHGGGASGKRNCKCVPCKTKKAEYMKAYQRPDPVP